MLLSESLSGEAAYTANDIKRLLGLYPHPREGGWFARTWESSERIAPEAFTPDNKGQPRYGSPRLTSTAIYYLLERETFSEMHVLSSDETFHHYMGAPVEQLLLHPDGSAQRVHLGKDLAAGQRPQTTVPRGVWQGARLLPGPDGGAPDDAWALVGCTVSPGFEYADYADAPRSRLQARWPGEAELIAELTRS